MGKIGFLSSWARRRAISRQAATRSACTSRSREVRSSWVMDAKARASSPTSSEASTAVLEVARAHAARTGGQGAYGPGAMRPERTSAVASAASEGERRHAEGQPSGRRPSTSASSVWGTATTSQQATRRVAPPPTGTRCRRRPRSLRPWTRSNAAACASGEPGRATQRPCRRRAARPRRPSDRTARRASRRPAGSRRGRRRRTPPQVPGRVATTAIRSAAAVVARHRFPSQVRGAGDLAIAFGQPDAGGPLARREDAPRAVDDLEQGRPWRSPSVVPRPGALPPPMTGGDARLSRTIDRHRGVGLALQSRPHARTPPSPWLEALAAPRARAGRREAAITNTANRRSGGTATSTNAARRRPRRSWPRRTRFRAHAHGSDSMRSRPPARRMRVARNAWTPERAPRGRGSRARGTSTCVARRDSSMRCRSARRRSKSRTESAASRAVRTAAADPASAASSRASPASATSVVPDDETRRAGRRRKATGRRHRLHLPGRARSGARRRAGSRTVDIRGDPEHEVRPRDGRGAGWDARWQDGQCRKQRGGEQDLGAPRRRGGSDGRAARRSTEAAMSARTRPSAERGAAGSRQEQEQAGRRRQRSVAEAATSAARPSGGRPGPAGPRSGARRRGRDGPARRRPKAVALDATRGRRRGRDEWSGAPAPRPLTMAAAGGEGARGTAVGTRKRRTSRASSRAVSPGRGAVPRRRYSSPPSRARARWPRPRTRCAGTAAARVRRPPSPRARRRGTSPRRSRRRPLASVRGAGPGLDEGRTRAALSSSTPRSVSCMRPARIRSARLRGTEGSTVVAASATAMRSSPP